MDAGHVERRPGGADCHIYLDWDGTAHFMEHVGFAQSKKERKLYFGRKNFYRLQGCL